MTGRHGGLLRGTFGTFNGELILKSINGWHYIDRAGDRNLDVPEELDDRFRLVDKVVMSFTIAGEETAG